MAEVNLGRIGFVNKGSWNSSVDYKINDVVKYGGSTYAAKRPNTGVTPPTDGTDTDDWFYFVNNSDYVDKTSNQEVTGVKNFTNGITTTEIIGETTFTESPIIPTPTADFQAVTKKYVDDKTIINNLSDKPTPDDTDNFALQEVGGDLKKVSYGNLFDKVSITGSATFNGTTQTIDLTGIGDITLAIGDVIEVTGTTSNNKLFTVESIPSDNQIIVNYEHRGTSTPVPKGRLVNETATATIKLYNRAKNAPPGQGQYLCIPASGRTSGVPVTNNTNREIFVLAYAVAAANPGISLQIDGFIMGNSSANSLSGDDYAIISSPVGIGSEYVATMLAGTSMGIYEIR